MSSLLNAPQNKHPRRGHPHDTPRRFAVSRKLFLVTAFALIASVGEAADLSPIEALGKRLFFDTNLSSPAGQSCASCHAPETGFTGPDSDINLQTAVYPGANPGRYGNRKPPSVAYVSLGPKRYYNKEDETWVGGQFYDGRANDLIEQAKGPLLNPLEMNNSSPEEVVKKVRSASYIAQFAKVFEPGSLDSNSVESSFDLIARAIAAYEMSHEVNSFSSKYDAYLAKKVELTPQELRGLALFAGKANCSACHPHEPSSDGKPPLFTDFTYDNLGIPRNEKNPFYNADGTANPDGKGYRDLGLGLIVKDDAHNGKFKVPTLRNVAKKPSADFVKAYLHNGAYTNLKDVVHYYNKRLQEPDLFPPPEYEDTVNKTELGNLGLTDDEVEDLVAFLETLTDEAVPTLNHDDDEKSAPISESSGTDARPRTVSKGSFQRASEIRRVENFRQRVIQASRQKESFR